MRNRKFQIKIRNRQKDEPREKKSAATWSGSGASELVFAAGGGAGVLNTRLGLWPLPNTRSADGGGAGVGRFCFGGGSMLSRDDEPAEPDCSLGFLAGGFSTSSSEAAVAGKDGRPMMIFLGGRFNFADAFIFEGGGSDSEGFDDGCSLGAGGDDGRTSCSTSLSLPYSSRPRPAMNLKRVLIRTATTST